jgi:hypothetical protein
MNDRLVEYLRMVAWANYFDLVHSRARCCLRVVMGYQCLPHHSHQADRRDIPHRYYNDKGCRNGSTDDHARLWYCREANRQRVYSFHEYNIPAPSESITEFDDRGFMHTIHPQSWYNLGTSMHVVSAPDCRDTFPYGGQIPRTPEEFHSIYRRVMGDDCRYTLSTPQWDGMLEHHYATYRVSKPPRVDSEITGYSRAEAISAR